jgi:acetolactate synthase-1/2/3 large subunit
MHTGFQDSTPMILLVGQVAREQAEREAFQEIDYGQMYGGIAKLALEITHADRTVELVNRALITAQTGRKGPVVISLPEDVLEQDSGAYRPVALNIARADFPTHVLEPIRQKLGVFLRNSSCCCKKAKPSIPWSSTDQSTWCAITKAQVTY